ncbi:hypothetical protein H4R33_000982 [Dimargaris cristalligena]|nr:hypothetical protein H4R33_000982 [Dimargaris cristalligena]
MRPVPLLVSLLTLTATVTAALPAHSIFIPKLTKKELKEKLPAHVLRSLGKPHNMIFIPVLPQSFSEAYWATKLAPQPQSESEPASPLLANPAKSKQAEGVAEDNILPFSSSSTIHEGNARYWNTGEEEVEGSDEEYVATPRNHREYFDSARREQLTHEDYEYAIIAEGVRRFTYGKDTKH